MLVGKGLRVAPKVQAPVKMAIKPPPPRPPAIQVGPIGKDAIRVGPVGKKMAVAPPVHRAVTKAAARGSPAVQQKRLQATQAAQKRAEEKAKQAAQKRAEEKAKQQAVQEAQAKSQAAAQQAADKAAAKPAEKPIKAEVAKAADKAKAEVAKAADKAKAEVAKAGDKLGAAAKGGIDKAAGKLGDLAGGALDKLAAKLGDKIPGGKKAIDAAKKAATDALKKGADKLKADVAKDLKAGADKLAGKPGAPGAPGAEAKPPEVKPPVEAKPPAAAPAPPPPAAGAAAGGQLLKLTLTPEKGDKVEVQFNPTEYTLSKATPWKHHDIQGLNSPLLEFTSGEPIRLDFELIFDRYEEGKSVREVTDKFEKLALVHQELHRPPVILLSWGKGLLFRCVVERYSVRYTVFLDDGTPVRAVVDATFKEFSPREVQLKGNPRHSADRTKRRIFKEGDTLSSIAGREYDDPTKWRMIADANAIDDPLAVQPGTELHIPPLLH